MFRSIDMIDNVQRGIKTLPEKASLLSEARVISKGVGAGIIRRKSVCTRR
jgi:hypothetical protein